MRALRPRIALVLRIRRMIAPERCLAGKTAPADEEPPLPEGTFSAWNKPHCIVSEVVGFGANIVNFRIPVSVYGVD